MVTWAYGPPEAFTGGEPTAAWDIYSLGATVYAMLTGQPPFVDGGDANVFTVLNRIGNVEVPDLRDRGISAPVADAVRQTMAKDPADRPASAAEFATMLTRPLPPPRLEPLAEPADEPVAPVLAAVVEPDEPVAPVLAAVVAPAEPVTADEPVEPDEPATPEPSFSRDSVGDPATEPRENQLEPAAVVAAEVEPEPDLEPEPDPNPLRPPWRRSRPRARPWAPSRRRPRAQGGVRSSSACSSPRPRSLSFLAIRRNLYEGYGSVLDDSFLADVGAWAPTVALVVGLVLLWRRTGVGAEWIIGAGASFVLLNYGGLVDFLRREDTSLDTTAMVMRTIAAALTVVAVVIAWRLAEVPGPASTS